MKKIIPFVIVLICFVFSSCKTVEKNSKSLLDNNTKPYRVITKEEAISFNKYFSLNIPKYWTRYIDGHNFVAYSPLGTVYRQKYKSSVYSSQKNRKQRAKDIAKFNKRKSRKKGSYWDNYIRAFSFHKDSTDIKTLDAIIDSFKKGNSFNYEIKKEFEAVKEPHKNFDEILYIKYGNGGGLSSNTHLQASFIYDNRVYYILYSSLNEYYDVYLNEAINIIKSINIIKK